MSKSKLHQPGVYKITNTVTSQAYVGSSKDIQLRWWQHKSKSVWKQKTNQMYKDMQFYGLDKFTFEVLYFCCEPLMRTLEQKAIERLCPFYNRDYAMGIDQEKLRKSRSKSGYKYRQSEKGKKKINDALSRLCNYMGHLCSFNALRTRLYRMGVSNPTEEAKKYIIGE